MRPLQQQVLNPEREGRRERRVAPLFNNFRFCLNQEREGRRERRGAPLTAAGFEPRNGGKEGESCAPITTTLDCELTNTGSLRPFTTTLGFGSNKEGRELRPLQQQVLNQEREGTRERVAPPTTLGFESRKGGKEGVESCAP